MKVINKHLCLYHDDADGSCSAWVVQRKHPDAECVAVQYGEPVPLELAKGRHVLVVDFSWPGPELRELANVASSLVVIDHHKTGRDRLRGVLPMGCDSIRVADGDEAFDLDVGWPSKHVRVVFDLDRSGASLTWDTLFPGENRPWFVDYVEDRDLWRWELEDSEAVNAYIASAPDGPESFNDFITDPRGSCPSIDTVFAGHAILRYRDRLVERMVKRARVGRLPLPDLPDVPDCGPEVLWHALLPSIPITNAPVLQSEVANELAKGQPFAAVYWDDDEGRRVWSLRSDEDGVDVSEIAKRYGGGGHPHAAGFKEGA